MFFFSSFWQNWNFYKLILLRLNCWQNHISCWYGNKILIQLVIYQSVLMTRAKQNPLFSIPRNFVDFGHFHRIFENGGNLGNFLDGIFENHRNLSRNLGNLLSIGDSNLVFTGQNSIGKICNQNFEVIAKSQNSKVQIAEKCFCRSEYLRGPSKKVKKIVIL